MLRYVFIALVLLSGCAGRSYLAEWNKKEITICRNKWCGQSCIDEAKENYCSGKTKLIGQSSRNSGKGVAYRVGSSPFSTVKFKKETCSTYECDGEVTP